MDRAQALQRIAQLVGPPGWITEPAAMQPYLQEQRGLYQSQVEAVVRPADTAQVAEVVRCCQAARIAVIPQGGNTGLCGGAASVRGDELILSLGRMNRIRAIDLHSDTMTVEAGCILAQVQQAAQQAGRLFPLSLAAEGSCQIGGNLATNAGGNSVLRYGNARDLVLGLEVVLADGRIWNGLSKLRKDNTGYDLKQLFLGSEGTLGIITAAVLKLFAQPREQAVAWIAVPDVAAAVGVLQDLRDAAGDELISCELISATALALVLEHIPGSRPPLEATHPWHVLIELASARRQARLQAQLTDILQRQSEQGLIIDAVLAGNQAQADALWRLRDSIPEAQRRAGASIKHDVSVPIANVPVLIEQATRLVLGQDPQVRVCPFGHLGDGNIHFNLSQPPGAVPRAFLAQWPAYNRLIHDLVMTLEGSISAEHGIGQLKREELLRYEPPVAIDLMRTLKRALDPQDLLNPGKVIP